MDTELIHHDTYMSMLDMLYAYEEAGINLTLSGEKTHPEQIVRACMMRESTQYVSDYIAGGDGKLREIRYTAKSPTKN